MEPKPLVITQNNIRQIFAAAVKALGKQKMKPQPLEAIIFCPKCEHLYAIGTRNYEPLCEHIKKSYGLL